MVTESPAPIPLDPKEALRHVRTLARAALDNGEADVAQEHLKLILAIVDKALPRKPSRRYHPPPEDEYGGGDIAAGAGLFAE